MPASVSYRSWPRVAVGATATGPIYRSEVDAVGLSLPCYLGLMQEMALRAVYPQAPVRSTIVSRLRGIDAYLGHAYLQGTLAARLLHASSAELCAAAATVIAYAEASGHGAGIEVVAASIANLAYDRVPPRVAAEIGEVAERLLATSRFTLLLPFGVMEASGATAMYPASATIELPPGWLERMTAADVPHTAIPSGDREAAEAAFLSPDANPYGRSKMGEWFGAGWQSWAETAGSARPGDLGSYLDTSGIGSALPEPDQHGRDEPFRPITNRERAGQDAGAGDIQDITAHSDKPVRDEQAAAAQAKAEVAETQESLQETSLQVQILGGLVGGIATLAARPPAIFAGVLIYLFGREIGSKTGARAVIAVENWHPGFHPEITHDPYTPNPDSDGYYGGFVPPRIRPYVPPPGSTPDAGPSDGPEMDPAAPDWRATMGRPIARIQLIDPLWDPMDMIWPDEPAAVDGSVPPKHRPVGIWRHVYAHGPGLAAGVTTVDDSKAISFG